MRGLILALLAATAPPTSAPTPTPAPNLPDFGPSTSLLVVAPHPDDELLCCAGVIQRVVQSGGRVSIVWVTSGDASELDLLVIEKSLFLNPAKSRDLAAPGVVSEPVRRYLHAELERRAGGD